jgi:hypothetical protein
MVAHARLKVFGNNCNCYPRLVMVMTHSFSATPTAHPCRNAGGIVRPALHIVIRSLESRPISSSNPTPPAHTSSPISTLACFVSPRIPCVTLFLALSAFQPLAFTKRPGFPVLTFSHPLPYLVLCDVTPATLLNLSHLQLHFSRFCVFYFLVFLCATTSCSPSVDLQS